MEPQKKYPAFLKPYLADCSNRLEIHPSLTSFMKSSETVLRNYMGSRWTVGVAKIGDNMYLQANWRKFVEENYIEFGDLLVFHYNGDQSILDLKNLGKMASEKHILEAFGFNKQEEKESVSIKQEPADDTPSEKPEVRWFKLNTHGSIFHHRNSAAAGGIIRDGNGDWFAGFAMKLGKVTITAAEFMGLREGLKIAWERRIQRIEVECNSEVVVKLIGHENIKDHPLELIVEDCKKLIRMPWDCKVRHIRRVGNNLADTVAKIGHTLSEDICVWEEKPEELLMSSKG